MCYLTLYAATAEAHGLSRCLCLAGLRTSSRRVFFKLYVVNAVECVCDYQCAESTFVGYELHVSARSFLYGNFVKGKGKKSAEFCPGRKLISV